MLSPGAIYATVVVVLLLVALGLAVPVLKGIVLDGLERRRKWKTGELGRESEDGKSSGGPPAGGTDGTESVRTCPHCGAENDPAFAFCGECAAPL